MCKRSGKTMKRPDLVCGVWEGKSHFTELVANMSRPLDAKPLMMIFSLAKGGRLLSAMHQASYLAPLFQLERGILVGDAMRCIKRIREISIICDNNRASYHMTYSSTGMFNQCEAKTSLLTVNSTKNTL